MIRSSDFSFPFCIQFVLLAEKEALVIKGLINSNSHFLVIFFKTVIRQLRYANAPKTD